MKYNIHTTALIAAALFIFCSSSYANVDKSDVKGKSTTGKQVESNAKGTNSSQANSTAKIKLVDINSAAKAELKTLPGINDTEADKIIAGRPYGSKAFLVTRNIIPGGVYEAIKGRIIARQK